MKSRILVLALLCAALVVFPKPSIPAERATEEDAVQMVETAGKMIEETGDAALAQITDPSGRCFDCERNLYVFVYSDDVVLLAHPFKQNMVGVSFSRHPEDYGNESVSVTVSNMIVEKAVKDGSGWDRLPCRDSGNVYDQHETYLRETIPARRQELHRLLRRLAMTRLIESKPAKSKKIPV